jgi:hypothetical protein
VASRQHGDPPWFHYKDAHHHNSLQSLTTRHLRSIALTRKASCCTKKNAAVVILAHFFSQQKELSVMNDEA